MKALSGSALKAELAKRAKAQATAAAKPVFRLEDFCFDRQLKFIQDPARFKTGVCSRRSGKTVSCAADLHDTTEKLEGDVAYITLNRKSAKKIIWRDLISINKQYDLQAKADGTELTLTKPNGNIIHVSGAKDAAEIEKFRGMKFRKVYIDECQSFRPYIQDLIEEVIEPALTDYNGSLVLIGTPGPVPAGYFYNISHNKMWSHHHWTMADNPHIKRQSGRDPIDIIKELAERRGLTLQSPSIQREYFGQWVKDADSLVYRFEAHNVCAAIPPYDEMTFIFGIDIGWKDSDAIAVLGYHRASKNVYLVHEYVKNKNDITALVEEIERLRKVYEPVKICMDAGALGKKIQEEIRMRHQIPVEAAEKQRKHEFIKLLNDDLRTGKFKALKGTRFEEDCSLVQWDWEDPAKPVISDRYHTDIGDAVLYAWRECKHYLYEKEPDKPASGTNAYADALEAMEAEEMQARQSADHDELESDVHDWGDIGVTDDYSDNDDF